MHSYALTDTAVQDKLVPGFAWEAALGYLGLAVLFAVFALTDREQAAEPAKPASR